MCFLLGGGFLFYAARNYGCILNQIPAKQITKLRRRDDTKNNYFIINNSNPNTNSTLIIKKLSNTNYKFNLVIIILQLKQYYNPIKTTL